MGIVKTYDSYFEFLSTTKFLHFEYMLKCPPCPPPKSTHINYVLNLFYVSLFRFKQVPYNAPEQAAGGKMKEKKGWGGAVF